MRIVLVLESVQHGVVHLLQERSKVGCPPRWPRTTTGLVK